MNEPQFKRGDRHPDGSERFFWGYRHNLCGTVEIWISYEKWLAFTAVHAKAEKRWAGRKKGNAKKRHNILNTMTCNQTQRILDYLARGKSHSFIMTACNVPASVILEAQKSA